MRQPTWAHTPLNTSNSVGMRVQVNEIMKEWVLVSTFHFKILQIFTFLFRNIYTEYCYTNLSMLQYSTEISIHTEEEIQGVLSKFSRHKQL